MRGDELGPLHGVPFTIKDSFDTAGVRTTRGSRLFADQVPTADAEVVARLERAGAIPLAKTNLPEFALWWETDNLVFGLTTNPWNVERHGRRIERRRGPAIAAGLSPLGPRAAISAGRFAGPHTTAGSSVSNPRTAACR